jgi:hypothetical protein
MSAYNLGYKSAVSGIAIFSHFDLVFDDTVALGTLSENGTDGLDCVRRLDDQRGRLTLMATEKLRLSPVDEFAAVKE